MRLFLLGDPVEAERLPVAPETLERDGLVRREGQHVHPLVRLTPHDGLLLASDLDSRAEEADYVPGMHNPSLTLAALTIRQPVERALDVGAGFGLQALLAARDAREVVATDVNPRALHYAALNARLNGLAIETRQGSWFESVKGESFDLVVANPPFVISPENRHLYRDSELGGEGVSRKVVREAARHLREGGYATVLANWICREGETWEPLGEWVEDSGCDALLLGNEPLVPLQYAARWNERLRFDAEAFEEALDRWLDHFEQLQAHAVGFGAVVLRRREGANWCRGLRLSLPATGEAARQLERLFAAADEPRPEDLSALRFRLPTHRLHQDLAFREGYELSEVTMTLDDGIGLVARVDARVLPLLFALDERPLGEVLREVDVDADLAFSTLRGLYDSGFVSA